MTYRFKLQEPIAQGVRRIGLEQIDIAAAKLGSKDDIPAAIHDARRCLKRLRALLRLVRPGLADTAYRRETERLAGMGRLLSGARDLFVMQQTLAKLEDRFGATPNGGGRAPAQAAGARPRRPPPLRRRRQAAGPAAPRAGTAAVHRQGRRRHRARARGRRTGSRLPQGPQSLPPRLPGAQRRDVPRLAQESAAALAAHVALVARLA